MENYEKLYYPSLQEVDAWADSVWALANSKTCRGEVLERNGLTHSWGTFYNWSMLYVRFTPAGEQPYYGIWQPSLSGPAPLVVHVPGYGAEMCALPEVVAAGYNVLHISPLGYATPDGPAMHMQKDGQWQVLPETVTSGAKGGYREWLAQCLLAIRWAQGQPGVLPGRVSFFGTSQGGGGSLLLGSLFAGKGVRCVAAEQPFLTNFPLAAGRGAYFLADLGLAETGEQEGWRALGFIDTLSHAHRLTCPTLLTAGGIDVTCPPETVQTLFERLTGIRSFTYYPDQPHGYTPTFAQLVLAWLRCYA